WNLSAAPRAPVRTCRDSGGLVSVRSMTGFARVRKETGQVEIVFSLKIVNHRGLDLHFHMSGELDPLENEIRAVVKSVVALGHLQIHVTLNRASAAGAAPLNRPLLHAYVSAFRE